MTPAPRGIAISSLLPVPADEPAFAPRVEACAQTVHFPSGWRSGNLLPDRRISRPGMDRCSSVGLICRGDSVARGVARTIRAVASGSFASIIWRISTSCAFSHQKQALNILSIWLSKMPLSLYETFVILVGSDGVMCAY
ncbi:hypothetical protein Ciccas_007529 [Cichlidogyrus casuarinus]|uniref:Uncharacterized protein n=1 Tax=Cichlidogyrus casuarinus TaxID=1844966 RepID=A0ABD2Q2M1_9PLAT